MPAWNLLPGRCAAWPWVPPTRDCVDLDAIAHAVLHARLSQPHTPSIMGAALTACLVPEGMLPIGEEETSSRVLIRARAQGWSHKLASPVPSQIAGRIEQRNWTALIADLHSIGSQLPLLPIIDLIGRVSLGSLLVLIIIRFTGLAAFQVSSTPSTLPPRSRTSCMTTPLLTPPPAFPPRVSQLPVYALMGLFFLFFASQLTTRVHRSRFMARLPMVLARHSHAFMRQGCRLEVCPRT